MTACFRTKLAWRFLVFCGAPAHEFDGEPKGKWCSQAFPTQRACLPTLSLLSLADQLRRLPDDD